MKQSKLTFTEVIQILQDAGIGIYDFAHNDFDHEQFADTLGPINEIDSVGGEGQGEHWHVVYELPDHDLLIKVTGFYSSYDGANFDGWSDAREVIKQTKTITVYE